MKPISLVNLAHGLIKASLTDSNIAIDATVGNGHDTVFLAKLIAPNGHVYGFDIQQPAIDDTLNNCQKNQLLPCVTLFHASHAQIGEKIPVHLHGKISAIMFNLGYFPGGNKQIITQTASTITALIGASQLLSVNGIMTILAYTGHAGGDLEAKAVKQWIKQLPSNHFSVRVIGCAKTQSSAPRLFVITKLVCF
jgi:16S rRNA C1402 N4-methylase RsmH